MINHLKVEDENLALKLLSTLSFYDLVNGTKECFFNDKEKFEIGTDMLDLFHFKILDKNIQNVLFKYSLYVENTFKTKIAYVLSKNYGVHIE